MSRPADSPPPGPDQPDIPHAPPGNTHPRRPLHYHRPIPPEPSPLAFELRLWFLNPICALLTPGLLFFGLATFVSITMPIPSGYSPTLFGKAVACALVGLLGWGFAWSLVSLRRRGWFWPALIFLLLYGTPLALMLYNAWPYFIRKYFG